MRRTLALAAALLIACDKEEPIEPGTETASATWDVDMFTMYPSPTIDRFDTLDGRRKLDGMIIEVDHTAKGTLAIENGAATPLAADDFQLQFYFNTLMQLGAIDEENPPADNEGPPFFGPGSFQAYVSADLPAGDQDPETEGTLHVQDFDEHVVFEAPYDWEETPTYLEAMIGEEPITVVVGGFSEMWVEWIDDHGGEAYLFAENTALRYAGALTITYEYSAADEE